MQTGWGPAFVVPVYEHFSLMHVVYEDENVEGMCALLRNGRYLEKIAARASELFNHKLDMYVAYADRRSVLASCPCDLRAHSLS